MKRVRDILTYNQIKIAFGNADFGTTTKRQVIAETLLKCVCGYSPGSTAQSIVQELGLVIIRDKNDYELTQRGKEYLFAAYKPYLSPKNRSRHNNKKYEINESLLAENLESLSNGSALHHYDEVIRYLLNKVS